jgi:hypothetical protein
MLKCCVVPDQDSMQPCPAIARAELYFGPTPCDYTHVCADHVNYFADVLSIRKLGESDHASAP